MSENQLPPAKTEAKNCDSLLSVGIDIGTTSTHLTLSRLHLGNTAVINQTPNLAIQKKEILYQSPIFFTPLLNAGVIDGEGVAGIIAREYEKAGVKVGDIQTGAVLITGESAKTRNAEAVVQAISQLAGEFVVESAGANLESILAGRGSGAARASKEQNKTIANVDIGGGTTNIAIFSQGNAIQTACIDIGGRFLSFDDNQAIKSVTNSGRLLLNHSRISWQYEDILGNDILTDLADQLARILAEMLQARQTDLTDLWSSPSLQAAPVDEYWFSGGVAALMQSGREKTNDPFAFHDMGIYLARALVTELTHQQICYHIPVDPIRATVIGAGLHTLQLTGSTIGVDGVNKPLRNLRLLRLPLDVETTATAAISQALQNLEVSWKERPLGLVFGKIKDCSFTGLKQLAEEIAATYLVQEGADPLVILTTSDVAMALAQFLKKLLPGRQAIVLDGIVAGEGDFIDIGRPIEKSSESDTATVPVVIKSLVFR